MNVLPGLPPEHCLMTVPQSVLFARHISPLLSLYLLILQNPLLFFPLHAPSQVSLDRNVFCAGVSPFLFLTLLITTL